MQVKQLCLAMVFNLEAQNHLLIGSFQATFQGTHRLAITQCAPRLDRRLVIPLPRPVPPPVMKATFP